MHNPAANTPDVVFVLNDFEMFMTTTFLPMLKTLQSRPPRALDQRHFPHGNERAKYRRMAPRLLQLTFIDRHETIILNVRMRNR
jgi:hypothetical protein